MFAEGFKYWLTYKKQGKNYYRCARSRKQNCPGRCLEENGQIRITTEHNHTPEPDRKLVDNFRRALTHRAATEKTDLHSIYWEEATSQNEASLLYNFSKAESAMRKARGKQIPSGHNTIGEVGEILGTSDLFKIKCGNQKENFYQSTIYFEQATAVICMHKRILERVGKVDEIHVNLSMEFGDECHLMTIHSVENTSNSVPIFYALLNRKSHPIFASVFAYLREHTNIIPSVVISDFDPEIQSALELTFPEANIKGNWFEFVESVSNEARKLSLHRETMRGHGASAFRMILVLPFLPADYMAPGFSALKKWMQDKQIFSSNLITLCQHVESAWLKGSGRGPGKMSLFRTTTNINNHLEKFNKELESMIASNSPPNPTVWHVLETLVCLATKIYVRQSRKVKPKKDQMVTEKIQQNATEQWIRTPIHLRSPLQFLQLTSHFIDENFFTKTIKAGSKNESGVRRTETVFKPSGSSKHVQNESSSKDKETSVSVRPSQSSSDPPPLAFFPVHQLNRRKHTLLMIEPPPLVPIQRRK